MISIEHEGPITVVGIFGEFEIADYKRFEEEVLRQLKAQGSLKILIDLRDMLGATVDTALEDLRFTRAHARDVGRVAILSDREAITWTALLSQFFVKSELRVFDDEALAKEWLTNPQSQ
ncbi:MAG TPA: STAS/SEC14 domain-containing protein [Burkholderiales bacterium]|nr:STAS/SEC14 domain-containing protein [Burkholderiales bacterium]